MSDEFIKKIAELRAKELFTKEFFETCTDSWYGDERTEFEANHRVGVKQRKPTEDEVYKYMGYLQKLKDEYCDNIFGPSNALGSYAAIIHYFREIVDYIEKECPKYKRFECDPEILKQIKEIGNYFVNKYNTILPEHNVLVSK